MKIGNFLLIIFLLISFCSCSKKISSIVISYNLSTDTDVALKDKVRTVYYYKKYTMVQIPVVNIFYQAYNKNGENIIDDNSRKISVEMKYYIFYGNEKKGIMYETGKDSLGKEFYVDSISKFYLYHALNFPNPDYANLSEVVKLGNGKELLKFAVNTVNSSQDIDSIYYYFDASLNNIPYSLLKELDSAKKMKLHKYVWISNTLYKNIKITGRKTGRPRELILEFYPTQINNKEEIFALFKRFRDQRRK